MYETHTEIVLLVFHVAAFLFLERASVMYKKTVETLVNLYIELSLTRTVSFYIIIIDIKIIIKIICKKYRREI